MQLSISQFKFNLRTTLIEAGINLEQSSVRFTISPQKEDNVKYSSTDDSARLWMLTENNLKDRYFTLDEAGDFLALPNQKFPIWIKVVLLGTQDEHLIFRLETSMRYRTPTQLKYIETGHPPFVFEKS